ncbi:DNA topoisomerase IV subunit A [uncultured bacterium]|nr:DNA topoisomerase IV subunit A [uncultured bacterium]
MKDKQKIKRLNLETVMSERFSRYSKSIIQQRALPDVRDGLKPVQRRILYAMNKDGNTYDKAFRKSAKAVGNVIGNFHPHGDSSIYEALIHMSQDWKMREPLIELHGNNGSMDGDPAAAMRYTESRTSKIAGQMLRDINKDTVSWVLNFDDTEYEPTVLPSRFPNLLVNGASGISSGYATQIPPHNLGEVIDAIIYLQSHPDATLDELMHFIKGPDFPTGGIIQGLNEIKKAYQTGRGRIIVRSRVKIVPVRGGRKELKITEIPFGVNKMQMVKQIDAIRLDKRINGIAEVRDETDRSGLTIVIELKRNADAKGILNYLYKNTDLQIAYHFNVVAIDHMEPKRLPLKTILNSYLEFQRQVIYRRTNFDLQKARQRQEIVKGLIKAMSILSQVIQTIRASKNRADASRNLQKAFRFTQRQADSIVALQLYRLTNTDVTALNNENKELTHNINYFHSILDSHKKLDAVLKHELLGIKKEFNSPRRTTIQQHIQNLHISQKVTVPNEDVVVLVSHDGYLKRTSLRSYKASPKNKNGLKPGDYPIFEKQLNTRNHLLMFTNKGHMIYRPVNEITNARWQDTGQHISQAIGLDLDEHIIAIYPFKSLKANGMFMIATSDGYIKRSLFKTLKPGRNYRRHASPVVNLKTPLSRVVNVSYLPDDLPKCTVMMISKFGYADRFDLAQVSVSGQRSAGVRGINLKDHDRVVNVQLVNDNDILGMITQRGAFKKQPVNEIPVTSRDRRGTRVLKKLKSNPHYLADFIKLNPDNPDQPIKIYTDHRRKHVIVPSDYPMNNLTSNGEFVVKTAQEGTPILMMY